MPGRSAIGRTLQIGWLRGMAALLSILCLSCAGTKKSLSDQARLATHIDAVIETLQKQLGSCDRQGIAALLAPPLAGDDTFSRGLADLCKRATDLKPVFVVERIWLKNDDTVRADVQWTLRATLAAAATVGQQERGPAMVTGSAHFTLVGKDSPRLAAIDGDNPFAAQFDHPLLP